MVLHKVGRAPSWHQFPITYPIHNRLIHNDLRGKNLEEKLPCGMTPGLWAATVYDRLCHIGLCTCHIGFGASVRFPHWACFTIWFVIVGHIGVVSVPHWGHAFATFGVPHWDCTYATLGPCLCHIGVCYLSCTPVCVIQTACTAYIVSE